jgi:hypothetical protein
MKLARWWLFGLSLLGVVGVAGVSGRSYAPDKDGIRGIVELLKKGDRAGARKAAEAYAKKNDDVLEVMEGFRTGPRGGLANAGIELTILKLARSGTTAEELTRRSAEFQEMGYNTAAISLVAEALAPAKDEDKKKKDWIEWSRGNVEHGLKLAEAAGAKNAAEVKAAADKLRNGCVNCHTVFRD